MSRLWLLSTISAALLISAAALPAQTQRTSTSGSATSPDCLTVDDKYVYWSEPKKGLVKIAK